MILLMFYFLIFLMLAIFMLGVGLMVLLKKKPIIIQMRWIFIVLAIAFSPMAITSFLLLMKVGLTSKALIFMLNPLGYIVIMLMFWFVLKGYCFIGVTEDSFREGLHTALNKLNIKFEETLSSIKLLEYDVELQVAIQPWIGNAQIKPKKLKDKQLTKSILNEMSIYFRNKEIKTNKFIPIFYVITGTLMALSMIAILLLLPAIQGEGFYNRGVAYYRQGNLPQAISDYNKAIEIDPNYAFAYEARAYIYFDKKEYEKAWIDVHKAETLGYKPDNEDLEFLDKLKKASGREK